MTHLRSLVTFTWEVISYLAIQTWLTIIRIVFLYSIEVISACYLIRYIQAFIVPTRTLNQSIFSPKSANLSFRLILLFDADALDTPVVLGTGDAKTVCTGLCFNPYDDNGGKKEKNTKELHLIFLMEKNINDEKIVYKVFNVKGIGLVGLAMPKSSIVNSITD